MKKKALNSFFLSLLLVAGTACSHRHHHEHEQTHSVQPKNIILLIGDGMGHTQVQAAMLATEKPLSMLRATHAGVMTTHSYDDLITDSGAGGTAIATGKKTRNGMIGMSPDSLEIPSMLDVFAQNGRATGVVVSCAVTHATPASFIAKEASRNSYENIAADFLNSGVQVVIGGGIKHFDVRKDGQQLTDIFIQRGFSYFNELPESGSAYEKLLVLTDSVHPQSILNGRGDLLPKGTKLALETLSKSEQGFFLMVEGSQIDWAGHANDSAYLVTEMFDFDAAVKIAFDFADQHPETLVIVTADHETGGLTLIKESKEMPIKLHFSSNDHSAVMVPVFAYGAGAEKFAGAYDNTNLITKILELAGFPKP